MTSISLSGRMSGVVFGEIGLARGGLLYQVWQTFHTICFNI